MLSRRLDAAVSKLSRQLQNCGSLPLAISSVQPLGAFSRHTAPFAPQPSSLAGSSGSSEAGAPRVMEAVELLVSLEGSGEGGTQGSCGGGPRAQVRGDPGLR